MRLTICLVFIMITFLPLCSKGQTELGAELAAIDRKYENKDTAYINARNIILEKYASEYPDSVLAAGENTIVLARRMKYPAGEVHALIVNGIAYTNKREYPEALETLESAYQMSEKIKGGYRKYRILNILGSVHIELGNYPLAFEKFFSGLKLAEAANDEVIVAALLNNIANIYYFQKNYNEAEKYYQKTLDIGIEKKDTSVIAISYNNVGEIYLTQKEFEKARFFLEKSMELGSGLRNVELRLASQISLAKTYTGLDSMEKANGLYQAVLDESRTFGDGVYQTWALLGLAENYKVSNRNEEAFALAKEGVAIAEKIGQRSLVRDGHELLSGIQAAMGNGLEAFRHHKLFKLYADSLNNLETERSAALQLASYEFSKKELQFERKSLQQKWFIFSAFAGLFSFGIIAFLINRNRRRLNRANHDLNAKNQKIELQKSELEDTIIKLTTTQSQLIQSEKMASLGELTAGIAHEIQNPLNFVNNFSEVSKELIEDVKSERSKVKGERDELLEEELLNDIAQNLEKINHHGKRADAIVKGMLQHSRTSSGQKEPTDINALCDEYLRLSYHGLKAKDPQDAAHQSFNASFHFEPDETLPKMNVVPQDIGRVLLNLINNAFYAVDEKAKQNIAGYEPTVLVSTRKNNNGVEIKVSDNGNGIPQKVLDKIFQPFFTTKPTGQGTGLGLSLSYDIVKAHGGELKVETNEGEGTYFIIQLHLKS
jgi:two-component system, NtrC family, sensor kinase